MDTAGAEVAAYIGQWRPSSVSAPAAAFARDVIAQAGPQGRERAKNLLWAAAKLAEWALPLGLEAVPEVLLHPSAAERFTRCAPTCGSSAGGWCRSCIPRICRCPGSGPSSPTALRRSTGT
ncbi:MAG TPA: hypothetical protein VE979_14725 [Streptosporangiaceae bacterium]|jgi:hypothetical protein|nr:hypothetical protein [Streptosporangiaceae bacterium]